MTGREWNPRASSRNVVVITGGGVRVRAARRRVPDNRIWLIQRGRGTGPLKPRQPASREHRA